MTTDSPDVLTGGRWECVRGVQRWVWDVDAVEPAPELPAPICGECERPEWRRLRRGLCPACYSRWRNSALSERPCVWCQSAFQPHDPRQTHCSASCARERVKARQQEVAA